MAAIDYSNPTKATITNNGSAAIQIQMYRVNLWQTLPAGSDIDIKISEAEEAVYYKGLEDGTPVEGYEVLATEPADWDAAYTSYFKKDDDGNVVPNDDDTFVADTFFKKVTLIVGQTISVTIA